MLERISPRYFFIAIIALLAWFAGSLAAQTPPLPNSLLINEAVARIEIQGHVQQSTVQLPHHWDRQHHAQPGYAEFEVVFKLPAVPSEPHGFFVPRIGNRFEFWLNGTLIARGGQLGTGDQRTDFGKAPRYFAIPPTLLQDNNRLLIRLEADGGRRAGLSALHFGTELTVRPAYEFAYAQRTGISLTVLTLMAIMTILCGALWWTQRASADIETTHQRDSLYAFMGLSALLWGLRLMDRMLEVSLLAWPMWGVLMTMAVSGAIVCMVAFMVHLASWHQHPWGHTYTKTLPVLILLAGAASAVALLTHQPIWLNAWYLCFTVAGSLFGLYFVFKSVRSGTFPMRLMAGAVTVNVILPAYDFWNFRLNPDLNDTSWSGLGSVLYALVMMYIVIARFRSASTQARELTQNLQTRVAEREAQLAQSYRQLDALTREQERTQERTRILRDLHDGVGAHISAAIWQVQNGQANRDQLLQTLRDSQDQLKLSIDSMQLQAGDVTVLLANLRYRLAPRFEGSGMALEWDVDELPMLPHLDQSAMRQLQFMLFEAFSNVLQHADASVLRVEAKEVNDSVQIKVIDNGRGLQTAQPSRGLALMRERAKGIGAALHIQSEAGLTAVKITLGKSTAESA